MDVKKLHVAVLETLNGLEFPTLVRPDTTSPNEGVVFWGINIYCYSVVAHLREILGSIEALCSTHPFLINVLTRNMHEWTAHAAYMNEHLLRSIAAKDFDAAWNLLNRSILGNRWLNGKRADPPPIRVDKAMAAYQGRSEDQFGCSDAQDQYGLLCELSHPNGMTLVHYWEEEGRGIRVTRPLGESELAILNGDLVSLLFFVHELMGVSDEAAVRLEVKHCLELAIESKQRATRPKSS